jgi:antitoxin (DNA-binding transcriptional repressor) of toxin-antitoxin stability system
MLSSMAVIHISETEAAKDFAGLIAKVREGAEVIIEDGATPVAVLHAPVAREHVRPLYESLRIARERGSTVTLDGDFGRDLEAVIKSHPEALRNPWE